MSKDKDRDNIEKQITDSFHRELGPGRPEFSWDNKPSGGGFGSYPTGNHNGYGENGNDGGGMSYGNSYGSNYGSNTRPVIESYWGMNTFNTILEMTRHGQQDGRILMNIRTLSLKSGNLSDGQIGELMQYLQWQGLNLDKFDVSYNNLGNGGVNNMFYTFSTQRSGTATYNIKFINLYNNQIGDEGAKTIATHLSNGHYPHLKVLDLTANQIYLEGKFALAEAVNKIPQPIRVLINRIFQTDTIVEGGKKQSDLFFGSSEQKKTIIKNYLHDAQSKGIDVKNVAVSKGMLEKIINAFKLNVSFNVGFVKCNVVPEDMASFATEKGIAKISKKATGILAFTDAVACYFETFEDTASSRSGVQYMLDIGIVGTNELLDNVE